MPVKAVQGCSMRRECRLLFCHTWTLQHYLRQTVCYTAETTKAKFTYDSLHRAFQGKEPCTRRIPSKWSSTFRSLPQTATTILTKDQRNLESTRSVRASCAIQSRLRLRVQ